jgi:hypothetical protein
VRASNTAELTDAGACRASFGSASLDAEVGRASEALCDAIVRAGGVDIEGAVVLGGALWLGLRAPLVDGHAALLRVVTPAEGDGGGESVSPTRFDAVAWLDLGGRGVRELSLRGENVVVVAGPTDGGDLDFQLRTLGAEAVQEAAGARLTTTLVGQPVPVGAEGLAVGADSSEGWLFVDLSGRCERGAAPVRVGL